MSDAPRKSDLSHLGRPEIARRYAPDKPLRGATSSMVIVDDLGHVPAVVDVGVLNEVWSRPDPKAVLAKAEEKASAKKPAKQKERSADKASAQPAQAPSGDRQAQMPEVQSKGGDAVPRLARGLQPMRQSRPKKVAEGKTGAKKRAAKRSKGGKTKMATTKPRKKVSEPAKAGKPATKAVTVRAASPGDGEKVVNGSAVMGRPEVVGKPWEAEGISRSLWYKRKKQAAVQ